MRLKLFAAVAAGAVVLAGCGGGKKPAATASPEPTVSATVSAGESPEPSATDDSSGMAVPIGQNLDGSPSLVPTDSPYAMVWSDEFDGTKLSSDWQLRPAATGSRPCTSVAPQMVTVSGGFANISAAKDPTQPTSAECPHGWLYNTQITTEASHQFKYGIFAVRLKGQKQSGLHGGFFLYYPPGVASDVPASDDAGSRGAEIDTVEYFGETNHGEGLLGAPQNSVYWDGHNADGGIRQEKRGGRRDVTAYLRPGRTPADDFHIYSVEWTPDEYIFRFDGHETFRLREGISRRPEFLFLSMLSSPFEEKYLNRDDLPATMQVDWVRVWQEKAP